MRTMILVMPRPKPMMDYRVRCFNISIPRIPHREPQHSRPTALPDTPFHTHPFLSSSPSPSLFCSTHPSPTLQPSALFSLPPYLIIPPPVPTLTPFSTPPLTLPPSPACVWPPNLPLALLINCFCIPIGRRLYGWVGLALFSPL